MSQEQHPALPAAITANSNPDGRFNRRAFLKKLAVATGSMALVGCSRPEAASNVAGRYRNTESVTRTPEQLQNDAERANQEAKRIALLAIDMLAADGNRTINPETTPDGTVVSRWTNRDGRTGDNAPGPEIHVAYDPRDGGTITTRHTQTVDREVRDLTAHVSVSGVGHLRRISQLRDQAHFGGAHLVTAQSGERSAELRVTYNQPEAPASGVFRVDTEQGARDGADPVAREQLIIDDAYDLLSD